MQTIVMQRHAALASCLQEVLLYSVLLYMYT